LRWCEAAGGDEVVLDNELGGGCGGGGGGGVGEVEQVERRGRGMGGGAEGADEAVLEAEHGGGGALGRGLLAGWRWRRRKVALLSSFSSKF
jgi:hypothetical protein